MLTETLQFSLLTKEMNHADMLRYKCTALINKYFIVRYYYVFFNLAKVRDCMHYAYAASSARTSTTNNTEVGSKLY